MVRRNRATQRSRSNAASQAAASAAASTAADRQRQARGERPMGGDVKDGEVMVAVSLGWVSGVGDASGVGVYGSGGELGGERRTGLTLSSLRGSVWRARKARCPRRM
jgi:hypothetical protein